MADQTVFCKKPSTVQFNSTGAGLAHAWDFGDGQTSTLVNPNHTYSAEGNYTVTLIVTNAAGCTDTLIRPSYIQIKEPVIQLTGLPQTGCNPVTANPSANVFSSEPVQTWSWNFGDGNFSNQATPTHTYTTAGNYNVTLVITTASGCKDSVTMVNGVRLGDKPVANFFPQPAVVCNSQPVQFTDSSTGNVDQWHWSFGDNMSSTEQNPSHVFGDVGIYTVTLIAWSNTCADTITKVNVVTILPPISAFTVQNSCQDKYVKQFKDASFGATTWLWNFGDGNTSTAQNPSHTYAAPGNYYVTLTVSNGSCWNVNYAWANVIDEKANFNYEEVICKGMADSFSTPAVNPANIASWQWSFGDGTSSNGTAPVVHYYSTPGTYIVSLTLTDVLGCVQTSTDTVKVFGPRAIFEPSVSSTCLSGNQVVFTDSSIHDGQNPIHQWQWNFGDGNIFNTASGAPLTHHYLTAGQYHVRLVVKDSYGCSDSASFSPLVVAQPAAYFYTADTLSCTSKNISFINQSTGSGLQYSWDFGDGQSAMIDMPVHQYDNMGVYDVSLLVTDQYGCKDSMVKAAYVHISVPKAAFSISDSIGTCPPMMVHFTNSASGFIQYTWDFGDGSSSTLLNPSHYYTTAGVYYPKLMVTGPGGCTDTATRKIIVKGPSGSFTYSPKTGCLPLAVNYNLVAENASSFVWDFSDGSTQPSISNLMTHTYTAAGDYIPKLILVDTAGCSVPIIGSDTIHVYGVKTAFSPSIRTLCGAGSIQFFNYTVANDLITSYQWTFGDGTSSTSAAPQHHFQQPGLYSIQLIAVSSNGCRDTATLIDGIKLLEKPDIKINGDSTSCVPATIYLNGQVMNGNASTLGWQWSLGNGNSFAGPQPPAQTYAADGNYTISVIVAAPNGCRDTALHSLTVFPLPSTNAGEDRSICRGESIQLSATGASNYIWSQHPSLACTSCATPLVSPTENLVYTVTGTNSFGCSSRDSVMINVKQPFILKVGDRDTICLGESVKLMASGADQYSWYPSTGIQNSNMGNTIALPQQTTTYHVIATDDQHCFTDTAEVDIKVWPLPTVNAGADQELIVGDALKLTSASSTDVTSWQWSHDGTLSCSTCPITLAKPKHTTTYTLKVTNDGGCVAQDHVTVNVICNNGNLFLPNTFSPNGDGMNDRFYPSGKGITMIKYLRVYNRWGQVVYERTGFNANDASIGWDGTFKGEVLPPDVYVYACEVVCQNNEVLSYKGDITLLR
jgi:gliding motility-associated-like protein